MTAKHCSNHQQAAVGCSARSLRRIVFSLALLFFTQLSPAVFAEEPH